MMTLLFYLIKFYYGLMDLTTIYKFQKYLYNLQILYFLYEVNSDIFFYYIDKSIDTHQNNYLLDLLKYLTLSKLQSSFIKIIYQLNMIQKQKLPDLYNSIKKNIANFPLKSKMYLNILMSVDDGHLQLQIPKEVKKKYQSFLNVFRNLCPDERKCFINKSISFVQSRIKNNEIHSEPDIKQIQTSCEVKTKFLAVSYWQKKNFKYQYNSLTIKLSANKKIQCIDLKSFITRKSKSQSRSLILQSYDSKIPERLQKITIKFSNNALFEAIYMNIFEATIQISNKRIQILLKQQQENIQSRFGQQSLQNGLTFLNHKTINEYFDKKQKNLQKLKIYREKVFSIHSEKNFKIYNSSKKSKYYYLQYSFPKINNKQQQSKLQKYMKIPVIQNTQLLQTFTNNISSNYYKCTINESEYEFIMVVERIQKQGYYQQIMKSINNMFQLINIQFINLTIKAINEMQYKLNIQMKIKFNPKANQKKSRLVIKLLQNMVNKKSFQIANATTSMQQLQSSVKFQSISPNVIQEEKNRAKYDSFIQQNPRNIKLLEDNLNFTNKKNKQFSINEIQSVSSNEEHQEIFYSIEDIQDDDDEISHQMNIFTHQITHSNHKKSKNQNSYYDQKISQEIKNNIFLYHFYIQKPIENYPVKLIQKHYLKIDWTRSQKGGVICIDQKAISEQKKVFKHIFNQLLKMQSVMNFSLPIQICRQESGLISIARNLSFAPLLLQNYTNLTPLQRIKKILIFQISMASLALSTKKPLNPVLGQTFQGLINGCPIYMEQISHHPPITSIYFVGRGYKIYGNVAVDIKLRLNYVKGVNDENLTIQFDNKQKIQFSLPVMVINGMIFGERSIYFEGKNHIIDYTNRIIAETTFNSQEKCKLKDKASSPDYLEGSVFIVQSKIFQKVIKGKKKTLPKLQQRKILSTFYGQWNGFLYYNQEKIFDFEQTYPYELQNYQTVLQSDSIKRKDVIQLKKDNVDKAQDEKILIEQRQRADKKLREAYMKTLKKIS